LQEPTADEPAIRIDIGPAPAILANDIIKTLGLNTTTAKKESTCPPPPR
jgi:gluconokinase/shikimate kinase